MSTIAASAPFMASGTRFVPSVRLLYLTSIQISRSSRQLQRMAPWIGTSPAIAPQWLQLIDGVRSSEWPALLEQILPRLDHVRHHDCLREAVTVLTTYLDRSPRVSHSDSPIASKRACARQRPRQWRPFRSPEQHRPFITTVFFRDRRYRAASRQLTTSCPFPTATNFHSRGHFPTRHDPRLTELSSAATLLRPTITAAFIGHTPGAAARFLRRHYDRTAPSLLPRPALHGAAPCRATPAPARPLPYPSLVSARTRSRGQRLQRGR